jgi:hypothetical protein
MSKIKNLMELQNISSYLNRIGAEPRSLKSAVVREEHGNYWRDLAVIRFTKDGDVKCSDPQYSATDIESAAIKEEFKKAEFPQIKKLKRIVKPSKMIKEADPKDIFEFRDRDGSLLMLQVRMERKSKKSYVPWTYWDDDEWRMCEPDGMLPLYNANRLADAGVVFIHEGAKAARQIQDMIDAKTPDEKNRLASHPWGSELSGAVHVGWIGGAMSSHRTDWKAIQKAGIKRAYIVADNDELGKAVVPSISRHLRIRTYVVHFTEEWPATFDLGDDFPSTMFAEIDGHRYYVGPSFRDCLHPATWITDFQPIQGKATKPVAKLRNSARAIWAYVREIDEYVCVEMPHLRFPEKILNKELAAFSDITDTSRLIDKQYRGEHHSLCYRPDIEGRIITNNGVPSINRYVPPNIKSSVGSPDPWLEFMEYFLPNADEKKVVEKWVATLIAKPENRIEFGLLLVSETPGTGKTTLGSSILAPLVGIHNVSWPDESQLMSDFTDWVAEKRLSLVNEIYAGQSWKVYNRLKSIITDETISVNIKYRHPFTVENWIHIIGCSNSLLPLKMDDDDRRWFYPTLTEKSWPKPKFDNFHKWIKSGGLGIIKTWAENYGEYFERGDHPPQTIRKLQLIEESRSEPVKLAIDLSSALIDRIIPSALLMKNVRLWLDDSLKEKIYERDSALRKAMKSEGASIWPDRIRIVKTKDYIILNDALMTELKKVDPNDHDSIRELIRKAVVEPSTLLESSI